MKSIILYKIVRNKILTILKYLQENLVQGRPLEKVDPWQCILGEINFIMTDTPKFLNTDTEEIQHLQNKFLTLEVQFYNEVFNACISKL